MRVHRSAPTRCFTVIPNQVLQDSRLSLRARGLLAELLSRSDGYRTDIRKLAQRNPEGRESIAAALRELESFGYLRRITTRLPGGQLITDVDVYAQPVTTPEPPAPPEPPEPASADSAAAAQVPPDPGAPGSGPCDAKPLKKPRKETPPTHLPPVAFSASRRARPDAAGGPETDLTWELALMSRVARAEPRMRLPASVVHRLVPVLGQWRERGADDAQICAVLTVGLPEVVRHPAGLALHRLTHQLPVAPSPAPPPPRRFECDRCGVPLRGPGLCATCRHAPAEPTLAGGSLSGPALARAALRATPVLPHPRR
jgi:hypothetical protein